MLSAPVLSPALSSRVPSLLLWICSLLKQLGRDFRMNFLNTTTLALCLFWCKAWTASSFYHLFHACPWAQNIPKNVGKPCAKQGQLEKLHCRAWCCVVDPCQKKVAKQACKQGILLQLLWPLWWCSRRQYLCLCHVVIVDLGSTYECAYLEINSTVQHGSVRWAGSVFLYQWV